MALNSFITEEGLEMGRAQVMQAEAAGIKPSVLMNPILLKPTNDVGSQVIVNGEVLGTMSARDYFKYKKRLVPDIMNAYNTLAEKLLVQLIFEGSVDKSIYEIYEESFCRNTKCDSGGSIIVGQQYACRICKLSRENRKERNDCKT